MYTLISGLYAQFTKKEEYNILIVGLDNAGKTTLLESIKSLFLGVTRLPPEKIVPTVGMNVAKVEYQKKRLHFWDLGGQTDLQKLWQAYYRECHGVLFVVDSTDTDRWREVVQVLEGLVLNKDTESVPVLLLTNKMDDENAHSVVEWKEMFNHVASSMQARESNVLAISALKAQGIQEAVEWLFKRMLLNAAIRSPLVN